MIKIAQDVLPITMLDVSGAAEIDDDPSQPDNRVGVSAAAISYVDIALMCSEVVCGWGVGTANVRRRRAGSILVEMLRPCLPRTKTRNET